MLSTIATLAAQSSGTLAGSAGTRRLLGGGHSWDHFECDCPWRSKYACPLDELFLTKIDRSGDGHIDRHEAIDLNAVRRHHHAVVDGRASSPHLPVPCTGRVPDVD